ncbi:MAG: MraY family glycosyltransferase [Luteimonas sp.]
MTLVALALACVVAAAVGTAIARDYALRRNLLDQPGARRSHAVPTPRGGGIAIVAVLLAVLAGVAIADPFARPLWLAAFVGLLLVAGVGWIDDHRALSPWLRLSVHAIAAVMLAVAVYAQQQSVIAAAIAFVLAIVLVNVWNFMDGIDGLAATQATVAAAGYALIAGSESARWLAIALAAACCGFLPFNAPRARIFLGDVGSGALGYLLAVIAVAVGSMNDLGSVLLLLPLSAFILDAALTLISRMRRGERWWTPHVAHAYQRWARADGDHFRVTVAYLAWSVIAVVAMLGMSAGSRTVIMAAAIGWYLGGAIVWAWLQARHGKALQDAQV